MKPLTPTEEAQARTFAKEVIRDATLAAVVHGFKEHDDTPEKRAKVILSFCLNSIDMTTGMEGVDNAEGLREYMKSFIREHVSRTLNYRRDGSWQD